MNALIIIVLGTGEREEEGEGNFLIQRKKFPPSLVPTPKQAEGGAISSLLFLFPCSSSGKEKKKGVGGRRGES